MRIGMTDEAVLAFLRRSFEGEAEVYLYPNVPPSKEAVVRRIHGAGIPNEESILALYDDTVLGSAEEGFVITRRRVAWKNAGDEAASIRWSAIDPEEMWAENRRLLVGEGTIILGADAPLIDRTADVFYVLALSARPPAPLESTIAPARSRPPLGLATTAPPPAGLSYDAYVARVSSEPPPRFACWHCATPLDELAPSCAWCGARRRPHGWASTG